ncbi:hypothetical protein HYV43_01155 [Candidatus Micrarchaeota archaeon]|nr:hypothetical protein [Candidatus Micrarchaeota archaeon]
MRQRVFSLFILLMLSVEMFAPLAWAQSSPAASEPLRELYFATPTPVPAGGTTTTVTSPTPGPATTSGTPPTPATPPTPTPVNRPAGATTGPACTIHSISDSERHQLQNFLFSPNGAFQGDFLNDLSDLDALARSADKPNDPFSKERKKQDSQNPDLSKTINILDVAKLQGLTGKTDEEIAKKFGLWDDQKKTVRNNGEISVAEAKKILAKEPKESPYQEVLNQITDLLKEKTDKKGQEEQEKQDAKQLEPYERFKLIMPGSGKEVSMADVFRSHKIDPESCLLKDEIINGRVGYIAILDADLTYGTKNTQLIKGTYTSPATGVATAELTSERGGQPLNQRIYGSSVVGYLNLNGGGNLVVPEFYRDWIVFSYAYTKADFYSSLIGSIAAFGAIRDLSQIKKIKEERRVNIQAREPNAILAQRIQEELSGKLQKNAANRYVLKEGHTIPGIGPVSSFDVDATGTLRYYNSMGTPVGAPVTGVNKLEEYVANNKLPVNYEGGLAKEIEEAEHNLQNLRRVKTTLDSRITASFMLAGGWLGPARMGFTLNNGVLFQARHQKDDKFLRILANKKVLADFKQASGFLGIGKIQELAAKYAGFGLVPEKAFYAKNLLLLNYPEAQKTPNYESTTRLQSQDDGSINILSRWRGPAYTLNYEDMRTFANKQSPESATSLAFVSNNIIAEPALEDNNLKSLTSLFSLTIPFIASRKLFELNERALGAGVFLTTLEFLDINENYGKEVACDKDEYAEFKNKYRLAFAGSVAVSALSIIRSTFTPFRNYLRQTDFWSSAVAGGLEFLDWTNPPDLWKFYIGNQAIGYTSNCRDQMHNILTWQTIPERVTKPANVVADKLPAISEPLSKLGLSKVIGAKTEEAQAAASIKNLKDVLNLRAVTQDQGGFVSTPEMLYVHIDQSTSSIKGGLYELVRSACGLQDRLQSKDGRSLTFGDGLEANNADGSKALSFQNDIWKLRAMARNKIQALARIIIPNTIIQSTLAGGSDAFLEIAPTGQSVLVNPPCDLSRAIFELTGRQIGSDFTQAIGKVRQVQTSEGDASLMDGQIDFVSRTGVGATVPTPEDLRAAITQGGRISVRNNGQVVLYGTAGSNSQSIGTLVSIIGDNGALHYDSATQQISLIIYSIFETSSQNIQSISMGTRGKGADIQVQAKRGLEDTANKLNTALDKIAGTEGITSFETKDHIYYITPDGKLRVIDKNTGKATDYTITGPITKDGNGNLVIPTEKGPFKINLTNENGQPTLNAEGPDGLKEALALLAARGQNGMLTFNPSTGAINVYNGQDVPMNPAFATQGIGYSGNADGTSQGVPADSPFLSPTSSSTTTSGTPPKLFLPSWPEQLPWAALFAGLILFGIVAIRFRQEN